jgi:hypothetical protein
MDLKTKEERVAYLIKQVPAARKNYKLLLLLYWQVFDGIDIPEKVVNDILAKGTEPESISRLKRKALGMEINTADIVSRLRKVLDIEREVLNGTGKDQGYHKERRHNGSSRRRSSR